MEFFLLFSKLWLYKWINSSIIKAKEALILNNKELFAKNLKSARKKSGLSQALLAEKLSYSSKAISKWESATALPPSEILPLLAKTLDTDLNSLFNFREDASYFLGIDGGGTKTKFLLVDKNNNIINELTLGPSNPTGIGVSASCDLFYNGIKTVCGDIPLGKVSVFIGAAGCGIAANQKVIYDHLKLLNLSQLSITSDADNIISAGLKGNDGVVAIIGTGSAIFSYHNNTKHQIGGYGHFIRDAFSGAELGRACIEAVFSDIDKSSIKTIMTQEFTAQNGNDIPQILDTMYKEGKSYMAKCAHFVFEAYEKGDLAATNILNENLKKFACQLSAALNLLPHDKKYPIVLSGGITNFSEKFLEKLKELITADNLEEIRILTESPVIGAVLLAKKQKEKENA